MPQPLWTHPAGVGVERVQLDRPEGSQPLKVRRSSCAPSRHNCMDWLISTTSARSNRCSRLGRITGTSRPTSALKDAVASSSSSCRLAAMEVRRHGRSARMSGSWAGPDQVLTARSAEARTGDPAAAPTSA
ncbi:hypothetical protein ACFQZ4_05630 [Catellatospora coxensis]